MDLVEGMRSAPGLADRMGSSAGALIDSAWLTVYAPWTRPASFLLLEAVFLVCAALTLIHAARAWRRDDGSRLFLWVCAFVYGLAMELISYNALDNFAHGQFTVMFYHHKLPLYVAVLYPVFIYTAVQSAARLGLSRAAEPFVVGLIIVALDMPFDILGPPAGWWRWSPDDPNLSYRWLGVPVTSYYWHLSWGGLLSAIVRRVQPGRAPVAAGRLALSIPIAVLNICVGVLLFLPFHGLKALGVADGMIVGVLIGVSLAVSMMARKEAGRLEPDRILRSIPWVYFPCFLGLAGVFATVGLEPDSGSKLAVIAGVSAGAAVLFGRVHRVGGERSSAVTVHPAGDAPPLAGA